ncbi:hypothetical protein HanRHA438_Chr04g0188051 [Helianthus annuus]|uniref:Uncharacterized protein n=1 Tax=Helianthus annuus TaxID=4232 RepID=A0A9K3NTU2_HELAN|nr:hypothetical protein HanXRQr2_Chr04g0178471 [Helianthus annuus]KAJ0589957.1 hypothetical protein HanIR_Chr04g0192091 [Helianthus annuus]KAJ0758479.1 hypothetical protein HanLR1_Chr04g0150911 [Helianthus annuus]KAJ0762140.1 hypothetical protein HanOQP8_Chr04g0158081 [Helianthus annuus]KAJ0927895.1 hypothetical protein HanRHA438_Chr04g0188051 [Helianthus annuus]
MVKDFWLSAEVNRSRAGGAGSVDAKIQGKTLSFGRDKVMKPLRRMSYESEIKFGSVVRQVPALKSLNATVAEEHDVQFVGVTVKPETETKILVTDDEGTDNDVELIESEQTEVPVRELPLMIFENLAAVIESLKDSLGNPPPVITPIQEEQAEDDAEDAESESHKKQRVDPEPSITEQVSPNAETEHVIQAEPEVTATAQENVIPDFFEMSFPETNTRSEPESSSGVRFEVGGSSSGGMSEQQEHLLRAAEKMKVFEESDSDDDDDVDVVKLQKRVVVLEKDSILKDA